MTRDADRVQVSCERGAETRRCVIPMFEESASRSDESLSEFPFSFFARTEGNAEVGGKGYRLPRCEGAQPCHSVATLSAFRS